MYSSVAVHIGVYELEFGSVQVLRTNLNTHLDRRRRSGRRCWLASGRRWTSDHVTSCLPSTTWPWHVVHWRNDRSAVPEADPRRRSASWRCVTGPCPRTLHTTDSTVCVLRKKNLQFTRWNSWDYNFSNLLDETAENTHLSLAFNAQRLSGFSIIIFNGLL